MSSQYANTQSSVIGSPPLASRMLCSRGALLMYIFVRSGLVGEPQTLKYRFCAVLLKVYLRVNFVLAGECSKFITFAIFGKVR